MRIPFNIKYRPQIESGEYKVETIDGNPVRIICWDRHNENKPLIVALISAPACDALSNYFQDGKPLSTDSPLLFIITPEPELTEFEQELVNFFNERNAILPDKDGVYNKHDCNELLHKTANKLLELAKKDMKEQMLKDAVEAYIVKSYNPCTENSELFLHGVELLYEDKNKPYLLAGNKVRIVILKDEEYG